MTMLAWACTLLVIWDYRAIFRHYPSADAAAYTLQLLVANSAYLKGESGARPVTGVDGVTAFYLRGETNVTRAAETVVRTRWCAWAFGSYLDEMKGLFGSVDGTYYALSVILCPVALLLHRHAGFALLAVMWVLQWAHGVPVTRLHTVALSGYLVLLAESVHSLVQDQGLFYVVGVAAAMYWAYLHHR